MGAEPPRDSSVRLAYIPGLDGLRALALLGIMLFHSDVTWARGGFLAVSTFFTLTGFLITSLLVIEYERSEAISFRGFYERRFRRLLPAATVTLAATALTCVFYADTAQLARLRGDALSSLFYCSNWWFVATRAGYDALFESPSLFQHFWSLSIEEQFYLGLPGIVFLVARWSRGSRRALGLVLGALTAASLSWGYELSTSGVPSARLYYGTDLRGAEMLMGALLALALGGRAPLAPGPLRSIVGGLGVLGFAVSAVFWNRLETHDLFLYQGGLALHGLATVAILSSVALGTGPIPAVLAWGPLRALGRVSYGGYLFHWPIFMALTAERTGLSEPALFAARFAATVALSVLSYRLLEEPIRRGRRLRGRAIWWAVPASAALVALALVAGPAPQKAEPMSPGRTAESRVTADSVRILVLGDSVAKRIGAGLARWGEETGEAAVTNRAHGGCGVGRGGTTTSSVAEQFAETCTRRRSLWPRWLEQLRPEVIVVLTGGWDLLDRRLPGWEETLRIGDPQYDGWLSSEFTRAIEELSAREAHIVWLTTPCVRPGSGVGAAFDAERIRHLNEAILEPLARERSNDELTLIDLYSKVCPGGVYADSIDGIQGFRPDGLHFSKAGSDWLARWLGPQLVERARERRSRVASR